MRLTITSDGPFGESRLMDAARREVVENARVVSRKMDDDWWHAQYTGVSVKRAVVEVVVDLVERES